MIGYIDKTLFPMMNKDLMVFYCPQRTKNYLLLYVINIIWNDLK